MGNRRGASAEEVAAGQAVYTKRVLHAYDFIVLGVSNRFVWKCPTSRLLAHYDEHVSANHLDVGIGTGYFLDKCRFPKAAPRIALMDLNPETLTFASRRIERYGAATYLRNVLEPFTLGDVGFDSVGVNYLLHCVPGSIRSKAVAFDHLKSHMNPGAVLFGSTLLHGGVPVGRIGRRLMNVYNSKGIFSNREDTLSGLEHELARRFRDISVTTVGCAALFSARV